MDGDTTPSLYTVLPEKNVGVGQSSLLSTNRVYDFQAISKNQVGQSSTNRSDAAAGVDIALNPDELDMSNQALEARYREELKSKELGKEDLSDMVSDHFNKQNKVYYKFKTKNGHSFISFSRSAKIPKVELLLQLRKQKNSNFDLSIPSFFCV